MLGERCDYSRTMVLRIQNECDWKVIRGQLEALKTRYAYLVSFETTDHMDRFEKPSEKDKKEREAFHAMADIVDKFIEDMNNKFT